MIYKLLFLTCWLIAINVSAQPPIRYDVTFGWLPVKFDIAGRPIERLKGYRVYISTQQIVECSPCPICPAVSSTPIPQTIMTIDTTTNLVTTKLEPGTYYVAVAAKADLIGTRSEQVRFSVPTTAPDKPKLIQINMRIP